MSRSYRHGRHNVEKMPWWRRPWNKEWWAARPYRYHSPSKHNNWWFKRALSKAERRAARIALALFVLACNPVGPEDRTLQDVVGRWDLQIVRPEQCTDAVAGGPLFLNLTSGPYDLGEAGVVNFVDDWDVNDRTPLRLTLIGHMDVRAGTLEFRLWKSPLQSGSLLAGQLNEANSFTGTLRDPIPGFDANFVAFGSCTYSVTGTVR